MNPTIASGERDGNFFKKSMVEPSSSVFVWASPWYESNLTFDILTVKNKKKISQQKQKHTHILLGLLCEGLELSVVQVWSST